jgi:hypothetical protein
MWSRVQMHLDAENGVDYTLTVQRMLTLATVDTARLLSYGHFP